MPLIGPDVVGGPLGACDAGEVERRHADDHAGGTEGRAPIDRHRATPEVVIPRDVAGIVHEEGAELGARERQGTGLGAVYERDVRRIVVEDVVVEDIVGADRTGRRFPNAVTIHVHDDVVIDSRVIVRRDGGVGGYLNAITPAVRHHIVGDREVGGAVVRLNAGGCRAGDDVVLDHRIGTGDVDPVRLIDLAPGADVVDHVADDLDAGRVVAAAVAHDGRGQLRAGHVMDAVADDLGVAAVGRNALDTTPGDIEVDDLDVLGVIRNGGAVRPVDLRAPFRV